jgi:hypothetical protein
MLGHSIVSQHFMEPVGSIPNSQELSICSYLGPTKSPNHWVREGGGGFPGMKREGREAEQLPVTSVEVQNTWVWTSLPIHLHSVVLQ